MRLPFLVPLAKVIRARALKRPPDVCIGGTEREGGSYMDRWYILPKNKYFCLYLHRFNHSDDDRALHDHPAHNLSFVFDGGYIEHTMEQCSIERHGFIERTERPVKIERRAGDVVWRKATAAHRIELLPQTRPALKQQGHFQVIDHDAPTVIIPGQFKPCWTLFVFTYKFRGWGYYCSHRDGTPKWVPQKQFIHQNGCGED